MSYGRQARTMRPRAAAAGAIALLLASAAPLVGQTVDYGPQRFDPRLRPTLLGYDPFGELLPQRFGLGITAGAVAGNNAIDFDDAGALILLSREDQLDLPWDVLSLAGKVRQADGLRASAANHAQARLLMAFGGLSIGLQGGGRSYTAVDVERDLVDLVSLGNVTGADFTLVGSGGWGLVTAEVGAHATLRLSAGRYGPALVLGAGGRMIRPGFYAEGALAPGGRIVANGDSLVAQVDVDVMVTEFDGSPEISDRLTDPTVGGSGTALDFMARVEFLGLAAEVEVLDVGSVTVEQVEHSTFSTDYRVSSVDSLLTLVDERKANAAGDTLDLVVQGVGTHDVSLPRTIRARVGYEATGWLYLDGAYQLRSDRFGRRARSEAGVTFAPIGWLPLRGGVVVDEVGMGYSGSVAFETGPVLLHVQAATLAGFMSAGRGAGAAFRFIIRM